MATGQQTITVAGYRRSDGEMAPYSSCGPVPHQAKNPALAAPCEEGIAHTGILGAGPRSGAAVSLRGTSFAAPQVGRRIGDLVAGPAPDARITWRGRFEPPLETNLARPIKKWETSDYWTARWGAGRMPATDFYEVHCRQRRRREATDD
jgi:hypothetical protein